MKVYFADELWAVLKWSSIQGLLPWYSSKMRCFVPNRIYTLFLHFILGLMYIFVVWETAHLNDIFIRIFLESFAVFSAMVQNVKLSICNVNKLSRLFYEMDQLDLKLSEKCRLDVSAYKYTTAICVIVYVLSAFVYFGAMITFKPEGYVSPMAVFATFFEYLFVAQFTLQLFILYGICKRSWCVSQVVQGYRKHKHFESDFVANIALLQRNISNIADKFNELFGWNTFLQIIHIFSSILYVIYLFVDMHGTAEVATDLLPYFIALFLQLVHILILSMKGQAISNDSDVIASFCCDLIANPRKDQNQNQVRDLLQQVSVKQARITAAGFFDVNFAMLFLLFNLLITYVIALVQILPN